MTVSFFSLPLLQNRMILQLYSKYNVISLKYFKK